MRNRKAKMELRDYLKIIGKSWSFVLGITAITAILVGIWSVMQPVKYEASVTVAVSKPNTVPQRGANYYQYDKYYSIQASSLYADTLAAWLSSPSTAEEIFEEAGLPVPNVNLRKLGRIFKPRRLPPVSLNITASDRDKSKSEKLVNASVAILEARTTAQNKSDDPEHHFSLIKDKTVVAENRQDLTLNLAIGLLAGLLIGLMAAFLRDYLKKA